MSSLAATKADGFYYPPDFDPNKHVSLNKYHGTHALRERAAKLNQGILVIRFEVPFHIWCSKCGEKIAKGERFNADKKAIGMYHSTKIWQFSMRHHCGCIITIQTDPKNTEYIVVEGARRKVEGTHTASDDEVIELPDDDEKERLARDALYRLEKGEASRKRARTAAEEVAMLLEDANDKHRDPYSTNARLRAKMRVVRKEAESLEKQHKALNLPEEIQLLPSHADDAVAAKLAFYAHDSTQGTAHTEQRRRRQEILAEPIFDVGHARAHAHAQTAQRQSGRPPAPARTGARHAREAQTVTSKERSDSSSDDGPLQGHNVLSGGSASHRATAPTQRTSSSAKEHLQQSSRRHGNVSSHPAGQVHSQPKAESDGKQLTLEAGGARHQEDGEQAEEGGEVALRAPAEQPGAASGATQGSTAAAIQKRLVGLKAVHTNARSAVKAWRAARQPATAVGQQADAQQQAGKRGGLNSKLPAAVVKKAQLLAMRQKLQGAGLQLPGKKPASLGL